MYAPTKYTPTPPLPTAVTPALLDGLRRLGEQHDRDERAAEWAAFAAENAGPWTFVIPFDHPTLS